MDSMVEIYLERASNEQLAAESLKRLSENEQSKEDFGVPQKTTFYSSVISHSYYAIFYAAKALLLTKGVKTASPNIHMRTFEDFKNVFVDSGVLDAKLLAIYREMGIRADDLLEVFKDAKWNRGTFTYKTIPQANKEPAEDSIRGAKLFLPHITKAARGSDRRSEP